MSHRTNKTPKSAEQRTESILLPEHAYQLILLHPQTKEAWESYEEPEEAIDPEHARKLAAIRTELMERRMKASKERK